MVRTAVPAALLALALAIPSVGCSQESSLSQQKVLSYLASHPSVLAEANRRMQAIEEAKATEATRSEVLKHLPQLQHDGADFVANPNGRVTVVEFFDYHCTYCKISAPAIVSLIEKNPDVRFVFKEFPFQTEISTKAATDQLLAKDQGKYVQVFGALMGERGLDEEGLDRIMRENGVRLDGVRTPQAEDAVHRHLTDNKQLAMTLGIDGTPAFIVEDQVFAGWSPEIMMAAIQKARKAKAATAEAAPAGRRPLVR